MAQVKPINKKKTSGPRIAALIVTIAILLGLLVSLIASTGIFVRMQEGASSEHYKVNGSMMSYYTNSVYQSWYQQYYYYILLGYVKFDPSKPLDEQYTDSSKKETYYDFFVEQAKTQVTKILKYCEAARVDDEVNFSELEAEAENYAKESIKTLKESAKKNNVDFVTFLRQNFGQYVSESDLHNALVIEHIASDYSNTVYNRIYDAMTDERKEEYFKDNLGSFITADYLTFSLSQTVEPEKVDEKAFKGGKDSQEYKDAVAAAKAAAKLQNEANKIKDREFIEKLAKAESADEFKRMLIEYKFDENFESAYKTAVKNLATEDKPSEEVLNAYKESVKQQIIDAVMDGKSDIIEEDDKEAEATADESTETKWEKAAKTIPSSVITKLNTVIKNATKSAAYTLDTDLGKFLFAGVKAQYGIEYDEDEKQGENADVNDYFIDEKEFSESEKEAAEAEGKYTLTVYYVTESAHRDESIERDVAHILFKVDTKLTENTENTFKTSDEAKVAAEALLTEIKTKFEEVKANLKDGEDLEEKLREAFVEIGEEKTADSNVVYESVNKSDSYVKEFLDWLFAAETEGELGLIETTYGWHIMYYGGEVDEAWRVNAHSGAASEDLTEWYEALEFEVHINDSIFKTIFD